MKTVIPGWVVLVLVLLSCSNEEADFSTFADDPAITAITGTWRVVSYENYPDQAQEFKTQNNSNGLDVVVSFDDAAVPKVFSGTNTTNAISAEFNYTGPRSFTVLQFITTEVAQPEWGNKFNEVFRNGDITFKVNANQLRLYAGDENQSVTLIRQ